MERLPPGFTRHHAIGAPTAPDAPERDAPTTKSQVLSPQMTFTFKSSLLFPPLTRSSLSPPKSDVEEHPSALSSAPPAPPAAGPSMTLASCGRSSATCMAVSPSSSSMLTSAPSATSSCTSSVWPCVTASCSGVWLRLLRMLISQRPCGRGRREREREESFRHALYSQFVSFEGGMVQQVEASVVLLREVNVGHQDQDLDDISEILRNGVVERRVPI
ncbi:hypothetical protein EYF80_034574 [Liparis tanakae]|uniref:Uncharacterized protein n=1 Tax=Liparis tanakae TaxID=230148 RepID=A0A4Z2GPK3_9TELE|nr:hypothetical protein EYF80_034574 [Liparis tanakae]